MPGALPIFVQPFHDHQLRVRSDALGAGVAAGWPDAWRRKSRKLGPVRGVPFAEARSTRGFTLLEIMVAACIFTVAFSGLYAASNHVMNLIRRSEDSAVAQRNCLARIDQLRNSAWTQVITPSHVAGLLAVTTGNAIFDKEVVSVYGAAVPATLPAGAGGGATPGTALLFTVTRTGTAPPVVSPANFDTATILDAFQLNFRVLTEWERAGKTHQRELSTLISKSASR